MEDNIPWVSERQHNPFAILTPIESRPRTELIRIITDLSEAKYLVDQLSRSPTPIAIDFETRGTDYSLPHVQADRRSPLPVGGGGFEVVGVGFASSDVVAYVELTDLAPEFISYVFEKIPDNKFIAHNAYFEAGVIRSLIGRVPELLACTLGLYKQAASEGWDGQRHGLKNAMRDLLNFIETNEEGLDRWLIDNKYVKSISKTRKMGYHWYPDWSPESGRWVAPNKSEMWRAPADILGHYCALDADATWQLYEYVLKPATVRFPGLAAYHQLFIRAQVCPLVEQRMQGIRIDYQRLRSHTNDLQRRAKELKEQFLSHPTIAPAVRRWEKWKLRDLEKKEPNKYKKAKVAPPEPPQFRKAKPSGKEPVKMTKAGTISKSWAAWKAKVDRPPEVSKTWLKWKENVDAGVYTERVISKNWEIWQDKMRRAIRGEIPEYTFNIRSGDQLRWLFYEDLGHPVKVYSDSGLPALDEQALLNIGTDYAKILLEYTGVEKELSYDEKYLELTRPDTGTLHPGYAVPGPVTGRLAGKNPNQQQIPKSNGTMSCFVPRDGHVFVDCDHKALEQVVLAELSEDPQLMKLYGPGARPNDVYLFVGSQLPVIGEKIRESGYDPDNPTKEGISAAKKECKRERGIAKTVVLASAYGAGAKKLHETLSLGGVSVTLEQVKEIHAGYWKLFSGVKRYEAQLIREWEENAGWVMGPLNYPIMCHDRKLKDIVNRVVQRTGHDIHIMYIRHLSDILWERNFPFIPIVWDWHDQTILECPIDRAEELAHIMEIVAYERLNAELQGIIPMAGEAMIVTNLAECKLDVDQLGYDPKDRWREKAKEEIKGGADGQAPGRYVAASRHNQVW